MEQLNDSKNSYKEEQKQFKKEMVEMSQLIENTLEKLDMDALEENMSNLSDKHSNVSKKEKELDNKIRETVTNILTRKRTTLGERYTIREEDFFHYGTTRTVSRNDTHKVLNRLNKEHFNEDENRWKTLKNIKDEYREYRDKWSNVKFKEEKNVEVEEPDEHVLDVRSNRRQKIEKIDTASISGGRYSKIRFRGDGRSREKVNVNGTYKSDTYSFKQVYLLASARNEIQEMQEKQMKKLLEKKQDLEKHTKAVKKHGKSFNVANKLSGI